MIWIDGEKWPPDLHGTGSEDYFGQAWETQDNAFLRNGVTLLEPLRPHHSPTRISIVTVAPARSM